MTNGGRWLKNHRETQVFELPEGGGWLMKLPQFSTLRQVSEQQGRRIEVFYSGRGDVPSMRGWAEAVDLGPVGPPAQVPPEQPGFSQPPGGGGPFLSNFRVTELHSSPTNGTVLANPPQFSILAQVAKQDGPRILTFFYGSRTQPAQEGWIEATDLGPIPQPAVLPPPGIDDGKNGTRPPLDYDTVPGVFNDKPSHFQVIDEGNPLWHLNQAEFGANQFCDCGPISLAHAINFTRWSQENPDTLNAHDGIVLATNAGVYGTMDGIAGPLTLNAAGLGEIVTNVTGVDVVVSRGELDFAEALDLARTRWIIVDNFSSPGHISIVVAFLNGSEQLALVQQRVNHGGVLDAGDLVITEPEWELWRGLTIHPSEALWEAPA
jgi:hypothetical protein